MLWQQKLLELKEKTGAKSKQIADGVHVSESTIKRIFSKKAEDHKRGHSIDVIIAVIEYLGGSFADVFGDTGAIVCGRNYVEMQEKILSLNQERDKVIEENLGLKAEVDALKNELLHTQISYKDEIIALYKMIHSIKNNNIET